MIRYTISTNFGSQHSVQCQQQN